ncbi:MAG: zinc ribbon domain-containing protein [Clostridia bacterium]|nr:zinc ribbon domain-containing protein [Clostridia bacterium]
MFCPKCGTQNDDSAAFCKNCGNALNIQATNETQPQSQPQPAPTQTPPVQAKTSDNSKIYKILSYIGILWLIGLLVNPEKNDPKVRFHVGQGIILTITGVALNIVGGILSAIIKAIFGVYYWGYYAGLSTTGSVLNALVWLAISGLLIALMVIGIVNAVKGVEKPLPVVGKFAFYK